MVICHQCSTENSDLQLFCEHCGASLQRLWAIIQGYPGVQKFYELDEPLDPWQSAPASPTSWNNGISAAPESLTLASTLFLDPQKRYRFLKPPTSVNYLPTEPEGLSWELHTQVIDCQPDQKTVFSVLDTTDCSTAFQSALYQAHAILPYAQAYLFLQKQFPIAIPKIHNAWTLDNQSVLLLEDRCHLPLLWDICLQDSVSPLQMLRWFQEMLHLWIELQPWNSLRSILEVSNLRVDPNQRLSLQRLYADPTSTTQDATHFDLQDLGHLWEKLFQPTSFGLRDSDDYALSVQVSSLIACVTNNMIPTISDLEIMLGEMLQEIQEKQLAHNLKNTTLTDTLNMKSTLPGIDPLELQRQEELLNLFSWPMKSDIGLNEKVALDQAAIPELFSEDYYNGKDLFAFDTASDGDDENLEAPTTILPMRLSALDVVTLTDSGKQRNHNEDYFSSETQITESASPKGRFLQAKGLYILCDGMGGHAGGEVASAMAADTLQHFFYSHWQAEFPKMEVISEGILTANSAIHSINKQRASSGNGRMGTTVVMALLQDTQLAFAHVGDSRLYRVTRKQGLECLTTDHEVGQREIQRGISPEVAYARPDAYQLTQALGPRDSGFVKPDIQSLIIREDSIVLLCSDGLTDNDLLETHWQNYLLPLLSSKASLDAGMQAIVDLANQYNGHDNISVVAIRIKVLPDLAMMSLGSSRS